ncbi:helicase-associated domain-containing protein [Rhodococcus aerolatus]
MTDPESLAAWLAERTDDELVELLALRPDLGVPPPADSRVLATRAALRASVSRAADELDAFTLATLEAVVVAGGGGPVDAAEVVALLGPDVDPAAVERALAALRERALVWGLGDDTSPLQVVPGAREAAHRGAARFGRWSHALADVDVPALVATLPEPQLRLLQALATGSPVGRTRDAAAGAPADRPVPQLLRAGLLVRIDDETVELPSQVGSALVADPRTTAVSPPSTAPAPGGTRVPVADVDAAAGGEALELLRHADQVLDALGEAPAPVLRSGGLGVRELHRVAKAAELSDARTSFLLEVLHGAGLLAVGDAGEAEVSWAPTTVVDTWSVAEPGARWSVLARAWLDLPRLPGLHGRRDGKDRPLGVFAEEMGSPGAPRDRRRVLGVLAERPTGTVLEATAVEEVLAWLRPRWGGRLRTQLIGWVLDEAGTLGLLGRGALSTPGRALLDGPDAPPASREQPDAAAAAAMAAALPAPVDHVLVQADLTVVAPGPLEPELAREVALVADVESAGAATVYRVGPDSVRRALDAGRGAAELHALFERRSRTPVPQALTYLIDDVARRHGRLRAGVASSFLRSDDPALLAEVLASSVAADLGLRGIAPTVAVSGVPLHDVLTALRGAGFAPAGEDASGSVLDLRPAGARVAARPPRRRSPGSGQPGEAQRLGVVQALRAGDRALAATTSQRLVTDGTRASGLATLDVLTRATRERRSLALGYVDENGVASQRVLDPISVGGGVLTAYDAGSGAVRRYALHRITSVALAG